MHRVSTIFPIGTNFPCSAFQHLICSLRPEGPVIFIAMSNVSVEIEDLKKLLAELIQSQHETEARFKDTDAKFKETDIRIQQAFNLFESQWGKLIESLVEGDLIRILRKRVKHVNRFLERLDRVKDWLPEYKNARIYGAVAFLRAEEESEAYAERQRLFVIRATGDSAAIVNQPGFEPRAF